MTGKELKAWLIATSKEFTSFLNFECDFKNGTCRNIRSNKPYYYDDKRKAMCCCHNCGESKGYLSSNNGNPPARIAMLKEKYGWTDEHGFWEAKKGCKLPRADRSPVCVFYICGALNEHHRKKGRGFEDFLSTLRGLCYQAKTLTVKSIRSYNKRTEGQRWKKHETEMLVVLYNQNILYKERKLMEYAFGRRFRFIQDKVDRLCKKGTLQIQDNSL